MKEIKNFLNSKEFILAYEKTDVPNIFYLKLRSPLTIQIELTKGCNQKCIFCYNIWKEGHGNQDKEGLNQSLSEKDHMLIIDKIIKEEVFDVIFSGGEPLLIGWLEKLIKKLSFSGINTMIITNGILLTKEKVKSLKRVGLNSLQISLHHFNEKINDQLVGNKGAFKKTVNGIKNTIEIFGKENVNVNMVALPETYEDVYKMAEFLNGLGIKSFSVGTPAVTGEMAMNKKIVINREKFIKIYSQLKMAEKEFNMFVSFTGGFPLCILPDLNQDIKMVSNTCDAGLNQLVISPEGNIKPCVCLNENLGNILRDNLSDIWKKNDFLLNIRKLRYIPNECKKCKFLSICRGGCRASARGFFGEINSKDPLME